MTDIIIRTVVSGILLLQSWFPQVLGESTGYFPVPQSSSDTANTAISNHEISPRFISLLPGQSYQFILLKSSGTTVQWNAVNNQHIAWSVINGGGTIDENGIFKSGNQPGTYTNTIKALSEEAEVFATVEVKADKTLPAPVSVTPLPITSAPSSENQTSPSQKYSPDKSDPSGSDSTLLQPSKLYIPQELPPAQLFTKVQDRVDQCLQDSFTREEYLRYFSPSGNRGDLKDLREKLVRAHRCLSLNRIPDLTPTTQTCLVQILGQERFQTLYHAQDVPTYEEINKISVCFSQPNLVVYSNETKPDTYTMNCLALKIGSQKAQLIAEGKEKPTSADIEAGRECFSLDTNILKPPLVIQSPPQIATCLQRTLGSKRYDEFRRNQTLPTPHESQKAQQCFTQTLSYMQQELLPAPSERIPFIPQDTAVTITGVSSQKRDIKSTLRLSGKALPQTVVDIYFFSKPLVVSTKTDENGNWNYELSYHLTAGTHQAYTVIKHPQKGLIRSTTFSFDVAYAQDDDDTIPAMMVVQTNRSPKSALYLIAAAGIILFGLGILLLVFRAKLARIADKETGPRPPSIETPLITT